MTEALAQLIGEGLDEIVVRLESAGIAATRDPGAFQPPGAIVGAPNVVGVTTGYGFTLQVPVYLVTPDPGQAGLDELLGMLVVALPAMGARLAAPTLWQSPMNRDGLPAYLIDVTLTVAMEG